MKKTFYVIADRRHSEDVVLATADSLPRYKSSDNAASVKFPTEKVWEVTISVKEVAA